MLGPFRNNGQLHTDHFGVLLKNKASNEYVSDNNGFQVRKFVQVPDS